MRWLLPLYSIPAALAVRGTGVAAVVVARGWMAAGIVLGLSVIVAGWSANSRWVLIGVGLVDRPSRRSPGYSERHRHRFWRQSSVVTYVVTGPGSVTV